MDVRRTCPLDATEDIAKLVRGYARSRQVKNHALSLAVLVGDSTNDAIGICRFGRVHIQSVPTNASASCTTNKEVCRPCSARRLEVNVHSLAPQVFGGLDFRRSSSITGPCSTSFRHDLAETGDRSITCGNAPANSTDRSRRRPACKRGSEPKNRFSNLPPCRGRRWRSVGADFALGCIPCSTCCISPRMRVPVCAIEFGDGGNIYSVTSGC